MKLSFGYAGCRFDVCRTKNGANIERSWGKDGEGVARYNGLFLVSVCLLLAYK